MLIRLLVFVGLTLALQAEIVDRLAIAVAHQAITELQIDEELRVTALLNEKPIVRDVAERRAAADRLVQQLLVEREMAQSHYPLPTDQEVTAYIDKIRAGLTSGGNWNAQLTAYDLTEATLREHLALQLTTLQFIEYRFRPDFGISEAAIESQYRSEAAQWTSQHPGKTAPPLASLRESIQQELIEQRIDQALSTWLEESLKQIHILYLDKSLQ